MEHLKACIELLEPDPRSGSFVKINATQPGPVPMMVDDFHNLVADIKVSENVPEDVRSYVETIKNLFVFGWFHYPFCTLVAFLATTAVEMALRKRYPKAEPDHRTFSQLLKHAKDDGLLSDERFLILSQRRAGPASTVENTAVEGVQPSFAEIISTSIPRLRNGFAHPKGHWIMPPGPALDMLIISVEVISAVWNPVP